jgi:serine/threonine-protein kinase haspin
MRKQWHVAQNAESAEEELHGWGEYVPYTNVLWVRYLRSWLGETYQRYGNADILEQFDEEVKVLDKRLNPRTTPASGGFVKALDILQFMMEQGWISEEQVVDNGFDSSMLSNS